ncbi:MAG: tetraacyldisaccharide 4'-kinase [Elusimicrobiota bacterium]
MSKVLLPLSYIYKLISAIHRKTATPVRLPRPVVSVGNITWGGTGKTPVLIAIASRLESAGLKTAVLTRGYARKSASNKSVIVSDGNEILSSPAEAGDEPFLLAEKLRKTAVVSGPDRAASAALITKIFSPDVFMLDDGFQHWKIKRDMDIVCVNASNPFGNGLLIPAGILREEVSSLSRADEIIITNADTVGTGELSALEERIRGVSGKTPSKIKYKISFFTNLMRNEVTGPEHFKGKEIAALSGIGENSGFKRVLENLGIMVSTHYCFGDHHWYAYDDLKKALSGGLNVLVTEKDAVKIRPLLRLLKAEEADRVYSAAVETEFIGGERDWQSFAEKIKRFS